MTLRIICLLCCWLLFPAIAGAADARVVIPGVSAKLLEPFRPLVQEVARDADADSRIDWGNRVLIARGKGLVQGGGDGNSKLMAQAAAKDFAIRNALALAGGVEIGINGRVKDFKNGRLYISALVKGVEVDDYYELKENGRTYWIAEIRLPMLGVSGLSVETYDQALRSHRRVSQGLPRLHPFSIGFESPPDDAVLVIDARGTDLQPSLYPVLVGSGDEIVLDLESVDRQQVIEEGLCRFVTTELSADEIERGPTLASLTPLPIPGRASDWVEPAPLLAEELLPQRIVIKGAKAVGPQHSFLRLSEAATERLREDRHAASLLYGGKVMVIVDAASTGQDGYLPGINRLVRSGRLP